MIIPALILILPFVYYVDKLILFKKSSQPPKVSFRVTDWVHFLGECSMLTFTIGWLLFCPEDLWTDTVEFISYLCLAIVVIYLTYRFRMVTQFQKYYYNMKKSRKAHSQCDEIMI
jgi:VanZ family protein